MPYKHDETGKRLFVLNNMLHSHDVVIHYLSDLEYRQNQISTQKNII